MIRPTQAQEGVEELIEQVDVLLRNQAVGGARGFLQAARDLAQIDRCHGGEGLFQSSGSWVQVVPPAARGRLLPTSVRRRGGGLRLAATFFLADRFRVAAFGWGFQGIGL